MVDHPELTDELIDAHLSLAYKSSGLAAMTGEKWDRVVAHRFFALGALFGAGMIQLEAPTASGVAPCDAMPEKAETPTADLADSPTMICPRCKVDRFKAPCPGPHHMCPMVATAQDTHGVEASAPAKMPESIADLRSINATLAGLVKRLARRLHPEDNLRVTATDYLKDMGFFNPLRNPGVTEVQRGK